MLLFGTHFIHLNSRIFNDLRYELGKRRITSKSAWKIGITYVTIMNLLFILD